MQKNSMLIILCNEHYFIEQGELCFRWTTQLYFNYFSTSAKKIDIKPLYFAFDCSILVIPLLTLAIIFVIIHSDYLQLSTKKTNNKMQQQQGFDVNLEDNYNLTK